MYIDVCSVIMTLNIWLVWTVLISGGSTIASIDFESKVIYMYYSIPTCTLWYL